MPGTPPNRTPPDPDRPSGSASHRAGGRRRLVRRLRWGGLVVVLAAVALVAAAVLPGSQKTAASCAVLAQASVAPSSSPRNTLKVHQTKVFDSNISARKYGTRIADQEAGVNTSGQMTSDLSPLPRTDFRAPVAAYMRYAERWAIQLGSSVKPLTADLRSGNRAAAKHDWNAAFSDYLHLGAVYGLLPGKLNDRLAEVPPNATSRACTGSSGGCGPGSRCGGWSQSRSASRVPTSRCATCCRRLRSTRSTTPPVRTRSWRTPSAT
jgi:hypothetical protein